MDVNAAVGGAAGLTREKIEVALGARAPSDGLLSRREQIALEYADRVSATPVDVPDDFFARLQAEFSEREIVELTAQIAQENGNAKLSRPLRIEANNFCSLPLPQPPATKED
jgi:alkylhydroperoxidase family enzyme